MRMGAHAQAGMHAFASHRVCGVQRLVRLADDLQPRCLRQAPQLVEAVGGAQSEAVALPLDLNARLATARRVRRQAPWVCVLWQSP